MEWVSHFWALAYEVLCSSAKRQTRLLCNCDDSGRVGPVGPVSRSTTVVGCGTAISQLTGRALGSPEGLTAARAGDL